MMHQRLRMVYNMGMKKQILSSALAVVLIVPLVASAAEWVFPEGTNCNRRVPHDPALNYPDGFKATVRFA